MDNIGERLACGCPGSNAKRFERKTDVKETVNNNKIDSELRQWPVQIQLVPTHAPYFENADLLIAADCSSYAYGNFHSEFMKNKITIIGCPKLDHANYEEKLTTILRDNNIRSVTVVKMEVPCCGGIAAATVNALRNCGKMVPWEVVTISTDGNILED